MAYQLLPDTVLDCERTNPFFNEQGEQCYPVSLPYTDQNRKLLLFPDQLSNKNKAPQRISATIEDGSYHMPCRQAVLGVSQKKEISTSFYMNEGAFYSMMDDITLNEIFGEETIPGVTTVEQALTFCKSLVNGSNPNFAIFPVLIDGDDSTKKDYKYVNRYGQWYNTATHLDDDWSDWVDSMHEGVFYYSVAHDVIVGDKTTTYPVGYYITPFIRANYLLKRVFQYLGYSLNDNFFTLTKPFTDMVFINNVADTIINGTIKLADLVPDITCSELLEIFRKKFHCEFIPDEVNKKMDIILFDAEVSAEPLIDLSSRITDPINIEFPSEHKQLTLKSAEHVTDRNAIEEYDNISILKDKIPTALFNKVNGQYFTTFLENGYIRYKKVATSFVAYGTNEKLTKEEISVPDRLPILTLPIASEAASSVGSKFFTELLYIGPGIFLHSTIIDNKTGTSTDGSSDSEVKQAAILAFYYYYSDRKMPRGTITNYMAKDTNTAEKLFDYSLCYTGPDGIYEKFYRSYDLLLRNSLNPIKAKFLLDNLQKNNIPSHKLILLHGQKLFIKNLKYTIGGKNEPQESELYTTKLYEPISSPKLFSELFQIII